MNNQPKITVITASYNYEKYIGEAITSVINQTYSNWELLVIDDGSKDNSIQIIQEFCRIDSRIKLLTHENNANKGLPETIKLALTRATGEYVAFLESDDIWHKDNLKEKVQALEKYNGADFIFNDVEYFGDEEMIKSSVSNHNKVKKILVETDGESEILERMGLWCIVPTFSCVMVKTEALKECNFETPYKPYLDWWLWYQIFYSGEVVFIDKKLTSWRMHSKSYIQRVDRVCNFKIKISKFMCKKFNNTFLGFLFTLISNKQIEKLFRPQVRALHNILMKIMLKKYPFRLKYHTL